MQLESGSFLQNKKYRILRTLGQGGFGITYEAEQVALQRRVAIKEFFMKEYCDRDSTTSLVTLGTSGGSKEIVERFRSKFVREAQMIASFDNPHIIKIYDIFEENGTAYYVMAFLDGGSLSDLVNKNGPLPEDQAVKFIEQAGDALDYIHKQNVLHLDVKPSNILLNGVGEAVLIDFGISKHYDAEGGQTSTTPAGISKGYAPMEQYQQGNIAKFSPATDIYSLGATLYFLLNGQTPPEAAEVYEDGLPEIKNTVSNDVKEAIRKAMAPKRKDRPQDIGSFLALLSPTLGDGGNLNNDPNPVEETKISSSNECTVVLPNPAKEPAAVTPKQSTIPRPNEVAIQSTAGSKKNGSKAALYSVLGILALAAVLWLFLRNPYSTEAERTYRKDAERGNVEAQYNLAVCFEEGRGVDQDYAQAAQWYAKAAQQGASQAQVQLGLLIAEGKGVKQDLTAACDLFLKAAEQGNINGQELIGGYYLSGEGVKQDWSEAKRWLSLAAERNRPVAQFKLGYLFYMGGNGITQDYKQAFKWFKSSAELGLDIAQFYFGNCYYFGYGTKKDYKTSVEWWEKAANQGYNAAQYNLGVCYENGDGVKKNLTEARKWYQKAAEGGFDEAKSALARIGASTAKKTSETRFDSNQTGTTSNETNTSSANSQQSSEDHVTTNTNEEIPYALVDTKPSFQGGDANTFSAWVSSHLSYPAVARENGVSGRVMVQFTVSTDGSITDVTVIRGVDPSLDQEALRVIRSSPKWTPGEHEGRKVNVTYQFPVIFQLK